MKKSVLAWIPRTLIILYILFISIFSLDAESVAGFFIHLIPSFILVAILVITWKDFKLAGILFVLAGIGTVIFFKTYQDLFVFLIISLIPIIAGILFFIFNPKNKNHIRRKK